MLVGKHGSEAAMVRYRLDVLEAPDERLRHRREFQAKGDKAAIKRAHELYDMFSVGVELDRYVLYEGDRAVDEYLGSKHGQPDPKAKRRQSRVG